MGYASHVICAIGEWRTEKRNMSALADGGLETRNISISTINNTTKNMPKNAGLMHESIAKEIPNMGNNGKGLIEKKS